MVRRAVMAGMMVLMAAAVAAAANVDGRWQGSISGPNGDMTITFSFKAQGSTLTGSVETPNGDMPISDGKIDGNKVSFKTQFQDNTIVHEGTISGDTMKLQITGVGPNAMDMTLKRVGASEEAAAAPAPEAGSANVDGKWQGSVSGPNGDFTITFNFKAEGTKLTGTVGGPNGDTPIDDGKIEGNKISFKTAFQDSTIVDEGTVSGDSIDLKVTGPWGESNMTLKRVAADQSQDSGQ